MPRACLEVITRAQAVKLAQKNPSLRSAFERATLWLDRQELPASWGTDIDTLLGPNWRGAGTYAVLIFYSLSYRHFESTPQFTSCGNHFSAFVLRFQIDPIDDLGCLRLA